MVCVNSPNAKGLNVLEKRRMLLIDLKCSRTDVAFVQETNFKASGLLLLQNRFFPCGYHACNEEEKSKGVSILIPGRIPWSLMDRCSDTNGHYLFLKGQIGGIKVTLATIYSMHQIFIKTLFFVKFF